MTFWGEYIFGEYIFASKHKLFTEIQDRNFHFITSNAIVLFCKVNTISRFIAYYLYLKLKLAILEVHVMADKGTLNSLICNVVPDGRMQTGLNGP